MDEWRCEIRFLIFEVSGHRFAHALEWEFVLGLVNWRYLGVVHAVNEVDALEFWEERQKDRRLDVQRFEHADAELPTMNLKRLERLAIRRAMEQTGYVQTFAAELLGVSRRVLLYKLQTTGLYDELAKGRCVIFDNEVRDDAIFV